ncbi:hypothetical protein BC941DRAFT_344671 [Chlamydoabsidia padenii]|nr:hypothetical protein BC941DRAFT_344671 [Chlamydoabsidia padenii]
MFVEPSPVPRFRNAPPAPPPSPPYLTTTTTRLIFAAPLVPGQTLSFSLTNAMPDDHLIVYKFLTSNSRLSSMSGTLSNRERYFVRPSAGLMAAGQTIQLCLNDPPPMADGKSLKDKILIRWAVIQRGTRVEAWTRHLTGSTRRKWLDMLLDEWDDQVVERKTRLKIRFVA